MTTLQLPYPPTANNLFGNGKKGRYRTKGYDAWIAEALECVRRQNPASTDGPYLLTIIARRPDKRRRDIANLEKPLSDLLVKAGVVRDDCDAAAIHLAWSPLPPGPATVSITITPQGAEA
jgi:Holliday junction resolvase RusA-like endonuclease